MEAPSECPNPDCTARNDYEPQPNACTSPATELQKRGGLYQTFITNNTAQTATLVTRFRLFPPTALPLT